MRREEYLDIIKEKTGVEKKYADEVIKVYLELLKDKLIKERKVNITNFGTFTLKKTKPHTIFSPVDGSTIKSNGVNKIYFSISKDFLSKL